MAERVTLRPVDAADVTIVVDNAIDILLPSTDLVRRPALVWEWSARDQLRAEHGYALLLTVAAGGQRATLLYDAGLGRDTAIHNLDVLGRDPKDVRAMVLSHGHADHHGGLEGLVRRLGRPGLPLVLHPDAWRERKVVFPTGAEIRMPPPSHQDLDREGWEVVEERGPSLLLAGTVLVTGQVERTTEFERGFPLQRARTNGGWEPDPWLWDDQAVVVHLRGRGLVVLSSCSHAGVINVLRHAQRLTGVERVHAFVGGLHLTGGLFEPIIPRTLAALAAIGPAVVVPGHCTGWQATHRLAAALPQAYVQTSVGTRLHFAAAEGPAVAPPPVAG
jgi:7,8-dihydropterin-6-yl-methyl-4-(beta-D-ribofuranosyl)aminobenzene 5'-phosphate synthase